MNPANTPQLDWRLVTVIVIVDAILRGIALWKSARSGNKLWFLALFVINSAGILPALYLFISRQKKSQPGTSETLPSPIATITPQISKKRTSKKS